MKVLFYDIETSPIIAACWGLYDQNIPYQHVIQDWHIICAAWKWEGGEIESIACNGKNDLNVVKKLHGLISAADAIVAHNGDNFDWKKLMARVMHHDLPPVRQPKMIDTLKQARKIGFTSRKLDDLADMLKLPRKLTTERGLWVKAAQGNKEAIKALETYCRGDIEPLEQLYHKLRPHSPTGLNIGLYKDAPCCPKCGCENMRPNGTKTTVSGIKQQWKCGDCGGHATTAKRIKGAFFR